VTVPVWLTLLVAIIVLGFGSFRVYLALKPTPPATEDQSAVPPSRSLFAGGFYRMGKRTHLFVGTIYILLGIALVATSFGFNPLGGAFGPSTEQPSKDEAPTKGTTIHIDQLPPPAKK
jgi:hypothetical protein